MTKVLKTKVYGVVVVILYIFGLFKYFLFLERVFYDLDDEPSCAGIYEKLSISCATCINLMHYIWLIICLNACFV